MKTSSITLSEKHNFGSPKSHVTLGKFVKVHQIFFLLSKLVSQDDEKGVFGWLGHLIPQILGQNPFQGAYVKQDIK